MEKTVGIAELTSITYGIAASDAMLKAGQVRMLRSAPMCPGKYLIVIGGDTGEVKAAMEAGADLAGKHLRNSYVIPHIHEQVLDALSKKSMVEPREAVGILESSMMVSAIYAADMAVKQAAVRLCRVRLGQGIGGKGVVIVAGDVGAVNAAVKAATDANESLNLDHRALCDPESGSELLNLSKQAHYCLSEKGDVCSGWRDQSGKKNGRKNGNMKKNIWRQNGSDLL